MKHYLSKLIFLALVIIPLSLVEKVTAQSALDGFDPNANFFVKVERGLLRVVAYGAMPIDSDGLLLNLRFTAVGAPGAVSPLTWECIVFNEGDLVTFATDGLLTLSGAS